MSFNDSKRIVIKIGSALIAPSNNGCSSHNLLAIAQFIVKCRENGQQVILVSSGSVAAGRKWFDAKELTTTLKKAMAATGQTDMMELWDKLFDFPTAQLLLTNDDLCHRDRYLSIKDTLEACLEHKVLPVVNENDTVTSDDRKVGDNDNLAAMVATAVNANVLVMCTDVNGLYDKNPHTDSSAQLIQEVSTINANTYKMAGGAVSITGTGGMRTKIEAAEKATSHGIDTYIINAFDTNSFTRLLANKNPGTHFVAQKQPVSHAVHWMTHTSKARGELIVDESTMDEGDIQDNLTSNNLVAVNGEFSVGDTIVVKNDDGKRLAKATTNYSSCLLNHLADKGIREKLDDDSSLLNHSIVSNEHIAVLGGK
ncbi:MAG: glutamate 5-kinase [Glaciecola sp.]